MLYIFVSAFHHGTYFYGGKGSLGYEFGGT